MSDLKVLTDDQLMVMRSTASDVGNVVAVNNINDEMARRYSERLNLSKRQDPYYSYDGLKLVFNPGGGESEIEAVS